MLLKKAVYDELVKKVNTIQTIHATDIVTIATTTQKLWYWKEYLTMIKSQEFNNLWKENFAEWSKQARLRSKKDITDFIRWKTEKT